MGNLKPVLSTSKIAMYVNMSLNMNSKTLFQRSCPLWTIGHWHDFVWNYVSMKYFENMTAIIQVWAHWSGYNSRPGEFCFMAVFFQSINHFWTFNTMLWAARKGGHNYSWQVQQTFGRNKGSSIIWNYTFLHKLSILAGMVHLDDKQALGIQHFIVKIF